MTGTEYEAALSAVGFDGWTTTEVAAFFGVSVKTEYRWRTEGPAPTAGVLLKLMAAFGIAAADARDRLKEA